MAADVLSQLLGASWRGISVPAILVTTKGGHGVVAHKRMDRDGWLIENTGRNSAMFSFKIPFVNTITRGPNETWSELYPKTYREFTAALEDRQPGTLVHPDYGERLCSTVDWEVVLDPDFRGGPTVQVTWMETADEDKAFAGLSSDFAIAASSAVELDNIVGILPPAQKPNLDGFGSFTEFVRSLQAVGDQIDLARSKAVAKIDRVVSQVRRLEDTYGRVNVGFRDTSNRFISAMHSIQQSLATKSTDKGFYVIPKSTTVTSVALRFRNSVTEILSLNPLLAGSPVVSAHTAIRYYIK
ncbi:DNA circularization N-terminal domain-containing protein [Sorangium sp. So ce281]|uniref:DNA circularization N-terminal domain-containing protein n=1 Tax=unclassified Sorangium TaxID=2621164 RepID=UPI003F62629D